MQNCFQALGTHIGTDALDDLAWRERFSENLFRQLFPARRNHIGLEAQLPAQQQQLLRRVRRIVSNPANVQRTHE